jgi:hypothetical protein
MINVALWFCLLMMRYSHTNEGIVVAVIGTFIFERRMK